jgi:non-ribosomal peptide synthetase component F
MAIRFFGRSILIAASTRRRRFANALIALGIRRHRVALFMPNCPQMGIAYYGGLRAGAVMVPCSRCTSSQSWSISWLTRMPAWSCARRHCSVGAGGARAPAEPAARAGHQHQGVLPRSPAPAVLLAKGARMGIACACRAMDARRRSGV